MDEVQYYAMQEEQAIAEIMAACAKAIFDSQSADTMEQLQRHIYKYNECGPAVSFELHEGACEYEDDAPEAPIGLDTPRKSPFVYVGDPRARTISEPWLAICKIGVSSIVEGSDAEVPLQWLDLEEFANDEKFEGDLAELCDAAVTAFGKIVEEVNDEACALWEEANEEPLWHALD
jgi:hypothetical protein